MNFIIRNKMYFFILNYTYVNLTKHHINKQIMLDYLLAFSLLK